MGFKRLTTEGEEFIKHVCTIDEHGKDVSQSTTMLQGNAPLGRVAALPFSSVQDENPPRIWKSNAMFNGKLIARNIDLVPALITWFNENALLYEIDANVVAAQAYQESKLKIWVYNPSVSSASGISQFIFKTAYGTMIANDGSAKKFTPEELAILTKGLYHPPNTTIYNQNLWNTGSQVSEYRSISRSNRTIFFQTEIDNPNLMIKAQCRLLKTVQNNNTNLASVALFLYSRGTGITNKKTYTSAIDAVQTHPDLGVKYSQEGLDYVRNIFGYLGDKNNEYIKTGKPKGIWFGLSYLYLNAPFNVFDTNVVNTILQPPINLPK
jgi:hypothetical protein